MSSLPDTDAGRQARPITKLPLEAARAARPRVRRRARGGQAVLAAPDRPKPREKARVVVILERDGFLRVFGRPEEIQVAVIHAVWAHHPGNERFARELTDLRGPPWVRRFLADLDVRELASGSTAECFNALELADMDWQLELIQALRELGGHGR